MSKFSISKGGWVVVADGEKALILENKGEKFNPRLGVLQKVQRTVNSDGEQFSDRPGRFSDGPSDHRSSVEQTDLHDRNKQQFARELANLLNSKAVSKKFDELIVVAPSNILHALRDGLEGAAVSSIVGELGKDLTNHPVDKIRDIVLE